MILSKRVKYIQIISISLFFFSFFSLVASLWLQNTLANFKFKKTPIHEKLEIENIMRANIDCSQNLEDCRLEDFNILKDTKKLGDCYPYQIEKKYIVKNNEIYDNVEDLFINGRIENELRPELNNKKIEIVFQKTNKKNLECIKNYKAYNLYKIFPYYLEFLYALKSNPKTILGASEQINPFIYGETSISNIVKRHPINYVFKTLLYISVIFMFLYWINYKFYLKKF